MTDSTPPTRRSSDQEPSASGGGGGKGRGLSPRMLAKLKLVVEGYELFERIGTGGQATVYRGVQLKDDRIVAIKILHSGPHATKEARTRLKREIAALRALKHPNIVQAIAAGRTRSGLDCLVMNYIDGRPLDALWEDPEFAESVGEGISEPAARLRLFKQICETVQAAHRKGITHRDLSPSNILIDMKGEPHILDFGMASTAFDGIVSHDVTVTGQFIGKLKYASPEQAKGAGADDQGIDIRSDVYALGVMLYQLLTDGAFPYEVVGNVIDVLNNIIYSQPKPPSQTIADVQTMNRSTPDAKGVDRGVARRSQPLVNETIEAIVLKALEKDPQQRYQSAGELAADIDRYLAGQPTSAAIWPKHKKSHKQSVRFRRAAIVAASIILTASLIGITMNVKTIAMYLGLTTVVAPVLPPELSPSPQSSADAAMMLEAEFLPDSMAGDRRLNRLADDLALVEARLLAVNRQLEAIGIKQPELEKRSSGSGILDVDGFADQLADASTESGRALEFAIIGKEDRKQQEQYEADSINRETNADVLLDMRRDLDQQQASLWMQIAYGTFTGRDIDRIFRYRTKRAEPMSEASMIRESVVNSGVTVRRTVDAALRSAAEMVGSGDQSQGGIEGGMTSLESLLSGVAEQTKETLVEFRSRMVEAKDIESLTDDDREAMDELAGLAKDLLDSLDGAAESQARLSQDAGERPRFINRRRLQRDLLDATAAIAQFDQGLVELSKTWEIEVNTASKLRAIGPAVAKATTRREKGKSRMVKSKTVESQFPIGSTWSGTWTNAGGRNSISGEVIAIDGNRVTLQITNQNGSRQLILEVNDGTVTLVESPVGLGHNGKPLARISNIDIDGTIKNGRLSLSGNWTWSTKNDQGNETIRYTFKREKTKNKKPGMEEMFPLGSQWSGIYYNSTNAQGGRSTTATVVRHEGGNIVVIEVQVFGYALREKYIRVNGTKLTLLKDIGIAPNQENGAPPNQFSDIKITGTISDDTLKMSGTSRVSSHTGKFLLIERGTLTLHRRD